MIPGSFFNETGLRLAVEAAVRRLEAASIRPMHDLAEDRDNVAAGLVEPIAADSA